MSRAVKCSLVAAVIGASVLLAACSGGSSSGAHGLSASVTPACPILAQLAATGETVAHADVGDPAKFHATLQTAVAQYVQLAQRLRAKVPVNLRSDVDELSTAAQQYRFSDAAAAHTAITDYARSTCKAKS